jgi:hypothetical protein
MAVFGFQAPMTPAVLQSVPISSLRPRRVAWVGGAILTLASCGCDDPAAIRSGDVRSYELPRAQDALASRPSQPPRGGLRLAYETPAGWQDRGQSGIRLATLVIEDGEEGHEVTVIPASGTLRANVDRWLGQLTPGLTEADRDRLADEALATADGVTVGDREATVVLLADPAADREQPEKAATEAILAAMIPLDGSAALFVKFKGPAEVARRERESFNRFVASIRWN